MVVPAYRFRIDAPQDVTARVDGMVKFDIWIEVDPEQTGAWELVEDGHFDVLIPAETIEAIDANPANTTELLKRKALVAAIIAVDSRLSELKQATTSSRLAINWFNLKVSPPFTATI